MKQIICSELGLCPAKEGTLCQCGRCKSIIFSLAKKAGIHPAALVDNLGLKVAKTTTSRVVSRPLPSARVAESMRVSSRGGEQKVGPQAIIEILTALNQRKT